MSEKGHGRRYTFSEKKEILQYLEKHTYKDTSEKYLISEATLSRWRNMIKSESKKNKSKIIISLPKFWLEYLNEQIESDVWEDYSEAILATIRHYFKSQKEIKKSDSIYLQNVIEVVPAILKINPDLESVLLTSATKTIFKSEKWESEEGVINLIETWRLRVDNRKKIWDPWLKGEIDIKEVRKQQENENKELTFQGKEYYIVDMSIKHFLCRNIKGNHYSHLMGLKRKVEREDIYILAKTKDKLKESNIGTLMNALKKIAMGVVPTPNQVQKIIESSSISSINKKSMVKIFDDEVSENQEKLTQSLFVPFKGNVRLDSEIMSELGLKKGDLVTIFLKGNRYWSSGILPSNSKDSGSGICRLSPQLRKHLRISLGEEVMICKAGDFTETSREEIPIYGKIIGDRQENYNKRLVQRLLIHFEHVNAPLLSEEEEKLQNLEKMTGRKIERIIATPEQKNKIKRLQGLKKANYIFKKSDLPWLFAEDTFPTFKYPHHFIALNGRIILITMLNQGLLEFPLGILNFKNLTYLCLNSNKIRDLPKTFVNLENLESLYLDDNLFTKIPDSVIDLPKLIVLSMKNNKVSELPLGKSRYYHLLDFSGNQIDHNSLSKKQLSLEHHGYLFI